MAAAADAAASVYSTTIKYQVDASRNLSPLRKRVDVVVVVVFAHHDDVYRVSSPAPHTISVFAALFLGGVQFRLT